MARGAIIFYSFLACIGGIAAASFEIYFGWLLFFLALIFIVFLRFGVSFLHGFIFAGLVLSAYLYFFFITSFSVFGAGDFLGREVSFRGILIRESQASNYGQLLTLELQEPFRGRIELRYRAAIGVVPGSLISGTGTFPTHIVRGETIRLRRVNISEIEPPKNLSFRAILFLFKEKFIALLRESLPYREAALASGLLFGYRGDFDPDFYEAMKASGTTHLVALSGYNIGILVFVLSFLLRRFFSRTKTFFIISFFIFLFALFVGGEASIVRAGIMGTFLLWAEAQGRIYDFLRSLVWTSGLMLLFDPTLLRFDLGFQLSFLSLLGVVYVSPVFLGFFARFIKNVDSVLVNVCALTFGAQITVLPLLLFYFGNISLSSFVINVLLGVFVPFAMFAAFAIVALGLLHPFLAHFAATLSFPVFAYFTKLIWFGSFFSGTIPFSLELPGLAICYILLAVWVWVCRPQLETRSLKFYP